MHNTQCISKGFYKHSQINNFISVKNYIFTERNGKKYLLLQFINDLKYSVNEMEYTLVELDSNGKEIKRRDVKRINTVFHPGSSYISSEGLEVDEKCLDFKVIFKYARADRFLYNVNGRNVIVNYVKYRDDKRNSFNTYSAYAHYAEPRRFGKPRLAAFLATLAILTLLGLNMYRIIAALLA